MGFGRAEEPEGVAAPHFGAVRFGVAGGEEARGDFVVAGDVFHAGHSAAAIPVRAEADMIRADDFECVQDVLHEVVKGGHRHGIFFFNGAPLDRHFFRLLRAQVAPAAVFGHEALHGFVALGIGRRGDEVGAEGIHLDHTSSGGELLHARVVDVARVITDGFGAGMREDDRRLGECDHLIKDVVGGVRGVEDEAEAVAFRDEVAAERAETIPLFAGGVGGGIGEVVVREMHGAEHAHAEVVKRFYQREVVADRISVFDGEVDDAFAGCGDGGGVISGGGEGEMRGMSGEHFVDVNGNLERGVTRGSVAGGRAGTLRRVDHPEAAIEAAFDHAGLVHLGEIVFHVVAIHDVPTGPAQAGRRVEVGVDGDEAFVHRTGISGDGKRERQHGQREREVGDGAFHKK